jgi:hypothetical protein
MGPAWETGGVAVARVYLFVVCVVLIAACGHAPVQQPPIGQQSAAASSKAAGCGAECQQAGLPGSPAPSSSPVSAAGCGTYCQQAGNSAGNSVPGYPCSSSGCLPCPPGNCITLQSTGAAASNGMVTVQLTCNLRTECAGAFLLCLPGGALCEAGPTQHGGGGRLAGSDFMVPAGATGNVPVALTDLGKQVASGPGGYEASVFVDLQDYSGVITNDSATGDFSLTTTDPPDYPPGATASCGGLVFTGPDTSCPFAENVVTAYMNSNGIGNVTVTAESPVNGETYTMQCTGESPVSCTGGTNALVVFYSS